MSVVTSTCKYCGSDKLVHMPCESGPHHAKECCLECGRQLRWVGKPVEAWDARELSRRVYRGPLPALLKGTGPQVEAARMIRARLLNDDVNDREAGLSYVLRSVTDAGWFLQVQHKPRSQWPKPADDQLRLFADGAKG